MRYSYNNEESRCTCIRGGGNASIRSYNKFNKSNSKPRSAGILTGTLHGGGYSELNSHSKLIIDESIQIIMELIQKYDYKRLYYSSDVDGLIGKSIFEVDESVRKYITKCLVELSKENAVVERVVRSISGSLEVQSAIVDKRLFYP